MSKDQGTVLGDEAYPTAAEHQRLLNERAEDLETVEAWKRRAEAAEAKLLGDEERERLGEFKRALIDAGLRPTQRAAVLTALESPQPCEHCAGAGENDLRVIWRDPQGQRCATFIPLPENVSDQFLAALADAFPEFTVYAKDDTTRKVREIADAAKELGYE